MQQNTPKKYFLHFCGRFLQNVTIIAKLFFKFNIMYNYKVSIGTVLVNP